ncbi:hypothetical protein DXG01_016324 [Tephrocybe rancida]|nr:hypothetical protein DXG01_016324 [Tephrocybe rancida]
MANRTPRVIIVGAGLAGISTAIELKKQLGFKNFTRTAALSRALNDSKIYEKATAVGGTWRGCGSDVPGHWYSLSSELNPNWSSYFVKQPEIRAYWEELFFKHDLPSHTQLGHRVISSVWDSEAQLYHVTVEEVATGRKTQTEAEIIIFAIGGFMDPLYPKDINGVEKFRGLAWHSARWRHDVDLKGKCVGVIGNGCSAWVMLFLTMQLVLMNRPRKAHSSFRRYPRIRRSRSSISAERHSAPGCKRIIVDPGYLGALHRPNVSLSWEAIKDVVEEGVELKSGEVVPLDVIIFGTGYSLESSELDVRGSKKTTLREYYASQGGPTAYLGTYRHHELGGKTDDALKDPTSRLVTLPLSLAKSHRSD